MNGVGGTVTLIYYKKGTWREEHPLNTIAAWATNSIFSHVEMAIGQESGVDGSMCNVLRVFNDPIGTELTQRTGKNPSFIYVQLGCTKMAEMKMLEFARQQVGKPFSMSGMVRSIIWPRKTKGDTYYCAELIAATLQVGSLLALDSNPGAATPESLYRLYKDSAACAGNPYVLRKIASDMNSERVLRQPQYNRHPFATNNSQYMQVPHNKSENNVHKQYPCAGDVSQTLNGMFRVYKHAPGL